MKKIYFISTLLATMAISAQAADVLELKASLYGQEGFSYEGYREAGEDQVRPIEWVDYNGFRISFKVYPDDWTNPDDPEAERPTDPSFFVPEGYYQAQWRVYANNEFTVSAPEGINITAIEFSMMQDYYYYGEITADHGSLVCNGGVTDVAPEDKKPANPYTWSCDNEEGYNSINFKVGAHPFQSTARQQFRFDCAKITYIDANGSNDPVTYDGDLNDFLVESTPIAGGISSLEWYDFGMAQIGYTFMSDVPMSVNKNCKENILLYYQGNVIAELKPGNDALEMEDEFPNYYVESYENDEIPDTYSTLALFTFSEEPIAEPGDYAVYIPNGFFLAGENDEYTLAGATYTYRFIEGESVGSFEDLLIFAFPEPGANLDIQDEEWAQVGISQPVYALEGADVFVDEMCEEPIVLTRDGEKVAEIPATATMFDNKGSYVELYESGPMSDNEFGGSDDDSSFTVPAFQSSGFTIIMIFADVYAGAESFNQLGEYTIKVPDGFFVDSYLPILGCEMQYTIIDSGLVAAETIGADNNVTVYGINGTKIFENAPAASLKSLEKGIYVINGKTVVLRK